MDTFLGFVGVSGLCAMIAGQIWLILIIMRGNPIAALLSIFIPFLILFFIREHWSAAKPAVVTWASGIAGLLMSVTFHELLR